MNNFRGMEFTRVDVERVVPFSTDDRYLRRLLSILEKERKLKVRGKTKNKIYSIWDKVTSGKDSGTPKWHTRIDNSTIKPNNSIRAIQCSQPNPLPELSPEKVPTTKNEPSEDEQTDGLPNENELDLSVPDDIEPFGFEDATENFPEPSQELKKKIIKEVEI